MTTTVASATDRLEHKLDQLSVQMSELAALVEGEQQRRVRLEELIEDAMPLARSATERLAFQLEALEQKGYMDFARAGAGVVDEIVENFSADDVRQLGEHIVLILETIKEMTQPEMLALLSRVIEAVDHQRVAIENEPAEPPSLWELARKTRDPAVRRGLGRALDTVAAVSATSTPEITTPKEQARGGK